ncbi:hypothetical protein [Marivirga sp.]|uniref:hypothetical protein n=1 Tax=Marivirga sp. TaxID=2018662 RepID=UPI003DA75C32
MKKRLNADRIVSVSAIIVSLATLLMILYQTMLTRKEQHVSVMPSLMIGYGKSIDSLGIVDERIWLENKGLGPAFIENMFVIDSTGRYNVDLFDYFERINGNSGTDGVVHIFPGIIVPENSGRPLHVKKSSESSSVILANYFEFPYEVDWSKRHNPKKAVIEIYYKSIYDDHWKIRSDSPIPVELD